MKNLLGSLAASVSLAALASAGAAPTQYRTPNIATAAGPVSATLNGQTFVNQGLQGVARLPSTGTVDFNGDTFGAFSSLDVRPGTWHRNADGSYGGTLFSLPDRGPNGVGSVTFSDYAGRTSSFALTFNPYTGAANLPVSAASQQQLQLAQTGGLFFRDFNNNLTTGLDPGAPGANAYVTENGIDLPGSKLGAAAGKISLDAEGCASAVTAASTSRTNTARTSIISAAPGICSASSSRRRRSSRATAPRARPPRRSPTPRSPTPWWDAASTRASRAWISRPTANASSPFCKAPPCRTPPPPSRRAPTRG